MKKIIIAISSLAFLAGCGSVNIAVPAGIGEVKIDGTTVKIDEGEKGKCEEASYIFFGSEFTVQVGDAAEKTVEIGEDNYVVTTGGEVEKSDANAVAQAAYKAICGAGAKDDDPKDEDSKDEDPKDEDPKDDEGGSETTEAPPSAKAKCPTHSFTGTGSDICQPGTATDCQAKAKEWEAAQKAAGYTCTLSSAAAAAGLQKACPPKTTITYTCAKSGENNKTGQLTQFSK